MLKGSEGAKIMLEKPPGLRSYSDFHIHLDRGKSSLLNAFMAYSEAASASQFLLRKMVLTTDSQAEDFSAYHCDCMPVWNDPGENGGADSKPPVGYHLDLGRFRALASRKDINLEGRVLQVHMEAGEEPDPAELTRLIRAARQRGAVCVLANGNGLECRELLNEPGLYWELSLFEPHALMHLLRKTEASGHWLLPPAERVRSGLKAVGVNGHCPTTEQLQAVREPLAMLLQYLVRCVGAERLLFATGRVNGKPGNEALPLLAEDGCVRASEARAILYQNAEQLLCRALGAAGIPARELPLYVRFVSPYKRTDPLVCTGSLLLDRGLAQETEDLPPGSILLTPCTDTLLSRSDALAARKGLCLLDAPWEVLAAEKEREVQRGVLARRIPSHYVAQNPFYRSDSPRYFSAPSRLGTAEAAGVALFVLGCMEQARKIFEEISYLHCYEELCQC